MHGSWGPWPIWWAACWMIPLGLLLLWALFHRRSPWRGPNGEGWRHPSRDGAMAILQERFARGEIDEDEYLRRRSTLDSL